MMALNSSNPMANEATRRGVSFRTLRAMLKAEHALLDAEDEEGEE